jgi:hypothetical protein
MTRSWSAGAKSWVRDRPAHQDHHGARCGGGGSLRCGHLVPARADERALIGQVLNGNERPAMLPLHAQPSQDGVEPVIDSLVAGLRGHGRAVLVGSFRRGELVELLGTAQQLVELGALAGGRYHELVAVVGGD